MVNVVFVSGNCVFTAHASKHRLVDEMLSPQQPITPVKLIELPTTKWVIWKRVGPLTIDVAGRQLVTVQYRGMGRGWHDEAAPGTFVQGALTRPATTDVWGA